jgi:hypothetical protein
MTTLFTRYGPFTDWAILLPLKSRVTVVDPVEIVPAAELDVI